MRKLLLILLMVGLIAGLLIGCSGVTPPPDGEEGEGEGEEEVARVVLVELFNTDGCPNCAVVEPILEEIAADPDYGRDKMVFVEEAGWGLYSTSETSARYKWYLPIEGDRSTPNILINGLNKRYHGGVSSKATLMTQINAQSNLEAKIKISAQRNTEATSTTVSGTVTNISSSDLSNLVVTLMTYKDRGKQGFRYSVTNILTEEIGSLTSAGIYTFSITVDEPNWVANGIHGAVLVQETASSKKEVLQVLYVE
jgi:thiol-disulfide isomerase/thioredoxin